MENLLLFCVLSCSPERQAVILQWPVHFSGHAVECCPTVLYGMPYPPWVVGSYWDEESANLVSDGYHWRTKKQREADGRKGGSVRKHTEEYQLDPIPHGMFYSKAKKYYWVIRTNFDGKKKKETFVRVTQKKRRWLLHLCSFRSCARTKTWANLHQLLKAGPSSPDFFCLDDKMTPLSFLDPSDHGSSLQKALEARLISDQSLMYSVRIS